MRGQPRPAALFAMTGRDDGRVYYCSDSMFDSQSARWILDYAKSRRDAYARLPLLFSPTIRSLNMENFDRVRLIHTEIRKNPAGSDPYDGLAFASWEAACALGLTTANQNKEMIDRKRVCQCIAN